jgi:glutamyl-tRNA reductase
MPIFACGINHKTAPIALREKIIFGSEKLSLYLQDLSANENVSEAVLLSTCNRSELYCEANDSQQLFDWIVRQYQVTRAELKSAWYCFEEQEAVDHIMQVACGLDSMVLGEPQILGQMKAAFSESCAAGVVGPRFNRLFQQVFAVAKEVRTNTAIGACPVSMASAAVNLAKQHFANDLSQATILLIGAGDTIQLVLRYLKTQTLKHLLIANRHTENATALAQTYGAENIPFNKMSDALQKADIVISATGSITPIVTKSMLADRERPICFVDLAVPRDIDTAVAELSSVQLYSIDDLKSQIQQNLQGREHAAEKAKEVIGNKSREFIAWQQSIDAVTATIRAYRRQIEDLSQAEMSKAMRQLERGDDPVQVLAVFANALTNKLLHTPSVQLRQAGVEGRFDILQLAQQLFAIPELESSTS